MIRYSLGRSFILVKKIKIFVDKTTYICYSTYRTTTKGVEYEYK